MTATDETMEKKKMSKTTVVLIATVALGVVGVLVSRGRASSSADGRAEGALAVTQQSASKTLQLSAAARARNPVKVAPAELTKLAGDIQVVGTVTFHEDHYAVVGPLVTGRISKLIAGVGDKVRRGQVIAEIESR